jgi:hypothetical protein
LGFLILVLVVFTDSWARSLVTVAHEGGHMVMAIITGRGYSHFFLSDGGGGATKGIKAGWGIGDMAVTFVGYPMPCLLGLGGAAIIRHGHAWSVLWVALVLLLVTFFQAGSGSDEGGWLAQVVVLLAFLGVGWVALNGSPYLQAAVAVGLVWWMLIGGAYWASVGGVSIVRRPACPGALDVGEAGLALTAVFTATMTARVEQIVGVLPTRDRDRFTQLASRLLDEADQTARH